MNATSEAKATNKESGDVNKDTSKESLLVSMFGNYHAEDIDKLTADSKYTDSAQVSKIAVIPAINAVDANAKSQLLNSYLAHDLAILRAKKTRIARQTEHLEKLTEEKEELETVVAKAKVRLANTDATDGAKKKREMILEMAKLDLDEFLASNPLIVNTDKETNPLQVVVDEGTSVLKHYPAEMLASIVSDTARVIREVKAKK